MIAMFIFILVSDSKLLSTKFLLSLSDKFDLKETAYANIFVKNIHKMQKSLLIIVFSRLRPVSVCLIKSSFATRTPKKPMADMGKNQCNTFFA